MVDINDLSPEVLSHILDLLEPRSWKEASQVCRRWYNILKGARFQSKLQMRIHKTFVDPPTEQEKSALIHCRNLLITQWDEALDYNWVGYDEDDEDDDTDEDEEENSEENFRKINVVEFKYLFEPSPEHYIGELLFSQELNLESLELSSTFAGCRYILEDRIEQFKNLTELILDIKGNRVYGPIMRDHTSWVLRHDRIRKLKLFFDQQMNNFTVITPSLTSLRLSSMTIFSLPFVTSYASQLAFVDLQLDNPGLIKDFFALKFPSLTHLRLQIDGDQDEQERYALLQDQHYADAYLDVEFVKSMPRLKYFRCESHMLFYRMAAAFAKFGQSQLEDFKLDWLHFNAEQLEKLQALPRLKIFKMRRCEILGPPETPHILTRLCLPYLEELSLVYNKSQIVFDEGLAGLKKLKITVETSKNHKILYKICNNLPNLEHLRICLNARLVNTAFRHLDRLTKLQSIRVDNVELNERLWQYCPKMAGVRKLVFTNGKLTMGTLKAAARLFPGLNELYLDECYFQNCDVEINGVEQEESDSEEDESIKVQYQERVRQHFPMCRVSFRHSAYLKSRYK
ncbi:uncharacterized protein LOC120431032 [Culex pipiens pallens]|uniref:uncharacterized protein LOC120431032 n=1 Tax=Culex pipiens pallens TaxID=42434 RepID=UPI001952D7E4|nr:uncharacterized protein LOC120431032 [Culex pipiens pallens]